MIVFPVGQDYAHNLKAKDALGAAISLAGASDISFMIFPYPREGAAMVLELTDGDGLTIDTPSSGVVQFVIDREGDCALPEGMYTGELWATLASGQRLPLIVEELRAWQPEGA